MLHGNERRPYLHHNHLSQNSVNVCENGQLNITIYWMLPNVRADSTDHVQVSARFGPGSNEAIRSYTEYLGLCQAFVFHKQKLFIVALILYL